MFSIVDELGELEREVCGDSIEKLQCRITTHLGLPNVAYVIAEPSRSASLCCDNFRARRSSVSSVPIARASVSVSLFLSAPIALGTAHIHLLDTESFSDYSPPMEARGKAILLSGRPQSWERTTVSSNEWRRQGKTESAPSRVVLASY